MLLLIVLSLKYTLLSRRKLFQFELTAAEIMKVSGDSSFCESVKNRERVILTCAETSGERNGIGGVSCARYLRARQSRFSVNLRVIPVISCLENHAVALMLHCLNPPSPSPHVDWRPYYSQSTPTILTMNRGSHHRLTVGVRFRSVHFIYFIASLKNSVLAIIYVILNNPNYFYLYV